MENDISCCVTSCERPLDQQYWDSQYISKTIGWDIGDASPPIQAIIDNIADKHIRILIPGCGNAYEAAYLLSKGFHNITLIDIAPNLVQDLQSKFKNEPAINIILGDFFEHQGEYDLILEQTFFCAIPPSMRQAYIWKMHQLLSPNGRIEGLLFNRSFEKQGPPFGGDIATYQSLFGKAFYIHTLDICQNSITPRAGTEVVFSFIKNNHVNVALYDFEGITCNGCMVTVSEHFAKNEGVHQVSMSSDYANVLIVSDTLIDIRTLQSQIMYDAKYRIKSR